jgi:HAD superfamily hydrolase (TIGR01509 family)
VAPRSKLRRGSGPVAVAFDMDGVLVDSEGAWGEIRKRFTEEAGGRWHSEAQREMMGMSSTEWSRYMHDSLGVPMSPEEISAAVAERVADLYRDRLPLLPGAVDAVRSLAERWPLAVASSANRELIDLVLELADLTDSFRATFSSDEVERGKPEPDVYLEAAGRLGVDSSDCAAVEDSASGIRAAHAARMTVVAIPNRDFPPDQESLELAAVVLDSLDELTPEKLEDLQTAPD